MEKIKEIIRDIFKNPKILSIKRLVEGFNNEVYEVKIKNLKKELIVKIIHHSRSREYYKKEDNIIKFIKKRYPNFPLPKNSRIIKKEEDIIIIRDKIPGKSLRKIYPSLNKKEKEKIFTKIGELKAKLNSIKFRKYGELDSNIKLKRDFKNWYIKKNKQFKRYLEKMKSNNSISKKFISQQKSFWDKVKHEIKIETKPSLCHGDSAFSNIVINRTKKGPQIYLIDFEFAKSSGAYENLLQHGSHDKEAIRNNMHFILKGYKKYAKVPKNWRELQIVYRYLSSIKSLSRAGKLAKEIKRAIKLRGGKTSKINKKFVTKAKIKECNSLQDQYLKIKH